MTKKSKESIEEQIIQLIKSEKPENIQQLVKLAEEKLNLSEKDILKNVIRLINENKIKLKEPSTPTAKNLKAYISSAEAYWFWTTISLAIATAITVFTVPEDVYPLVYVRYVLGSIFVLWLPGYTLIKALFPSKKEMDSIERLALSIGLSLAIVPIVGLLLNYTPWGIRLTPITLSLLALTICFALAALIREHQIRTSQAHSKLKSHKK